MMLADSSKLVIVFYTKPLQEVASPVMKPCITVAISQKNGENEKKNYHFPVQDCSFSKEKCEVKLGKNTLKGDLKNYEIHLDLPDMQADIHLEREVNSWRPATGHMFFGKKEQYYFAWLPSVPKGKITGSFSYKNEKKNITGSGYHDHNWGNYNLYFLLNHWYWCRVDLGEYTVITSQMIGAKKYGYQPINVFMVAKNGEVVAEDGRKMTFTGSNYVLEPTVKRPLYRHLAFDYKSSDTTSDYSLVLQQKEIIEKSELINALTGNKKRVAKFLKVNPTYLRMEGKASLAVKDKKTENISVQEGEGIWEQFYFRKNID